MLATTTTYKPSMQCGECILGNYTFCIKGEESQIINTQLPTSYCCNSTSNCTYMKDPAWNCTSKYKDYYDRFKVCPFYTQ